MISIAILSEFIGNYYYFICILYIWGHKQWCSFHLRNDDTCVHKWISNFSFFNEKKGQGKRKRYTHSICSGWFSVQKFSNYTHSYVWVIFSAEILTHFEINLKEVIDIFDNAKHRKWCLHKIKQIYFQLTIVIILLQFTRLSTFKLLRDILCFFSDRPFT